MRRAFLFLFLASCGGRSVTIAMVAQNNSGQDGTATLTANGTTTDVLVKIKASSFPGQQSSHVHAGRCDNVLAIDMTFGLISDKADSGAAIEGGFITFHNTLNQPLSYFVDHNHVINVHDARDNALYTSCGEIE